MKYITFHYIFRVRCMWVCTGLAVWFLPRCMECRRGVAMKILSVRLSVKRGNCDKTEERSVQIFIPYEKSFSLVFWEEEWLVGATHSTWNFGSTGSRWSEIADFEPIIARKRVSRNMLRKKSINTNRKSTTRFPMSLRWSSYVAPKPPKGGSMQNGWFPSKVALRLKKVCYKVSLCENCQQQSCNTFIGLTICAKMIGGEQPLLPEILDQTDRIGAKLPIFDLFSLVATHTHP